MAAPTFGLAGTAAGATGVASPAYPATVNANDIAILIVETSNQPISAAAIGDGSWTQFASVGTGVAAAIDSIALQAFWRRCAGTEASATVALPDSGDHTQGRIYTFVGCVTSGDPIHAVNTSFNNTASTSFSVAGFTTTVTDCLVVCAMGRGNDSSSVTAFSTFANADLTSVSEPASTEVGTTLGTGGGFGVGIGTKATAGTVGNFTATCTASAKQANIQFALKSTTSTGGGAYTLTADNGSYTVTGTATGLTVQRLLTADAGSYALTGAAATFPLGKSMVAANGAYTLTGGVTNFALTRAIIAANGSYTLTGTAATLTAGRMLTAVNGSYTLTGTAANLQAQRQLIALAGSYTVTGTDATLLAGRALDAVAGSYALTGGDATLTYTPVVGTNYTIAAEAGIYTLVGGDALLTYIARDWFIREDAPPLVAPSQLAEPAAASLSPVPLPPSVSVSIAAAPGLGAFVRVPPPAAIGLED